MSCLRLKRVMRLGLVFSFFLITICLNVCLSESAHASAAGAQSTGSATGGGGSYVEPTSFGLPSNPLFNQVSQIYKSLTTAAGNLNLGASLISWTVNSINFFESMYPVDYSKCGGTCDSYTIGPVRPGSLDRVVTTFGNSPEIGGSAERIAQQNAISGGSQSQLAYYVNVFGTSKPTAEQLATNPFAADRAWYKGYYSGLQTSFKQQGLDPFQQGLPGGPMQAWAQVNGYYFDTSAVDTQYAQSNTFDIIMPYEREDKTLENIGLDKTSSLGMRASPMVRGTAQDIGKAFAELPWKDGQTVGQAFIEGMYGAHIGGYITIIATDSNFVPTDPGTVTHELNHAAWDFAARISLDAIEKANLPDALREQAIEISQLAKSVWFGQSTEVAEGAAVDPEWNREFLTDVELLAYAQEGCRDCIVSELMKVYIVPSDAEVVADSLLYSPTLQMYRDKMDAFVTNKGTKNLNNLIELVGN